MKYILAHMSLNIKLNLLCSLKNVLDYTIYALQKKKDRILKDQNVARQPLKPASSSR